MVNITYALQKFQLLNIRKGNFGIFRTIKLDKFLLQKKHMSSEVSAGILIIGDEILKGVTDVNTPFLIKQLTAGNVKVNKVAIVPDNIDAIAAEVRELSTKCTFVLTSGGIGPTHDDVTYEALSKAFNDELHLNQDLFKLLMQYFGPESSKNPGIIKYSCIPKSAVVNYVDINHNNKILKYPIVSVRNIYVFPGVPIILQKSFEGLKSRFIVSNKVNFTKEVFIDLDEFSITHILNNAVEKFRSRVKFGSYPTFTDNYYKVKLVLESPYINCIEEASKYFLECLPEGSVVNIKENFLSSAKDDVYSLCKISPYVSSAVSIIEEAIEKYSLSEMCVCFNGGKDCTALLHLLYSCVQHLKPGEWSQVHFLYVRCGESFTEVEYFIQSTADHYNFKLTTLDGSLKHAISHYLKRYSNIKAIFIGTRKCDPGASDLHHFCLTDSDWPSVIRILPLLNWTYSDVWFFLRNLQIPYCALYDRGYTSLGLKSTTVQNPSLLLDNHKGFQSYKPAYMLLDSENERESRL